MSYIIDEMINEKVEKIDNERECLDKLEKEEIKKTTAEIKKKYSEKKDELYDERRTLKLHVLYLDAWRASQFIAFLVSEIEDKSYRRIYIPIKYKGKTASQFGEDYCIHDYIVCGLTDDETKVEIKANELYTEEDLNKEYEHFFRLYHYDSEIDEKDLKVNFLADKPIKYCNYANPYNHNDSCISGEENNYKFTYIRYVLEKIIEYRIINKEYDDFYIGDYIRFLREYIKEYEQDKLLLKKSLRDPSFY